LHSRIETWGINQRVDGAEEKMKKFVCKLKFSFIFAALNKKIATREDGESEIEIMRILAKDKATKKKR
jgi:hypothetical protein